MRLNELIEKVKEGEGERLEFKESIDPSVGKTITAFLNTNGGLMLIGVRDDGHVSGVRQKDPERELANFISSINPRPSVRMERIKLDGSYVIALHIEKSEKLHTYGNIGYVRIGSTTRELELSEIIEKAGEALLLRFDQAPCPGAGIALIPREMVERYLEEREKARNISKPKAPYGRILEMLGITAKGNVTNGGLLFFSKAPQAFYPQASLRIVEFAGETMEERLEEKTIGGSLWEMIDMAYSHLSKSLRREAVTKGFRKIISPAFPLEALQEAVINALIHRNYFDPGDVRIFIFSDRLEVINPGSFPPDVTPEAPVHRARNSLLSQFVFDIGYIEKYGSGILKMKDLCRRNGYPSPEFSLESRQTKVTFRLMPLKLRVAMPELDEVDKKMIEYLLKQKSANAPELAALTELSKTSVVERLGKLIIKGLITRTGRGKATSYSIT